MMNRKITCLAPWTHSHITANNSRALCCVAGNLQPAANHTDFWNNEYMKHVRKQFLKGESVPECSNCFGDEANREESSRYYHQFDTMYGHMVDDILANTNPETGETTVLPVYLDYRNSLCNLKCKTCNSGSSSTIASSSNKSSGKQIFQIIEYKDTFASQWEDMKLMLSGKIRRIYWAGGEPLMNPIYWKTMQYLMDNGWTDIEVVYNSNLTRLADDAIYDKALKIFRAFDTRLSISLDGIQDVNDYIRAGSNWDSLERIIARLGEDLGNDRMIVDATLTNLTFLQLPEMIRYLHANNMRLAAKAMLEFQGFVDADQYHDANFYLTVNLLTSETFDRIVDEVTAVVNELGFDPSILDLLHFMKTKHEPRSITEEDIKCIQDYEARHEDKLRLADILTKQSLD